MQAAKFTQVPGPGLQDSPINDSQVQTQTQTQTQTQVENDEWQCEPVPVVRAWGRLYLSVRPREGAPSSSKTLGSGRCAPRTFSADLLLTPPPDAELFIDLKNEQFKIGRGFHCDYRISKELVSNDIIGSISKEHFMLTRDISQSAQPTVLHDFSHNGTFINGQKVGKGKKRILENEDTIAVTLPTRIMFVFLDLHKSEDSDIPKAVADKYYVSKVLGTGACGVVKLVYNKMTCKKYAMKIITKKSLSNVHKVELNDPKKIINEVNILKSLRHPCIIQTEEVFDTPDTVFIIMELMEGGELFDMISKCGRLSERSAKIVLRQMLLAVKYLHDQNITHRDLKPENILLESVDIENCLVKLTDFGLSKFMDGESFMKTMCGTPLYVAPEVLLAEGRESYNSQVDVWSLGVIFFICLCGYLPFSDQYKDIPLREQIIKGRFTYSRNHWASVSKEARKLVGQMLTTDPNKRITIGEIFKHPWMQDEYVTKKVEELLEKSKISLAAPIIKRQLSDIQRLIDPVPKRRKIVAESSVTNRGTVYSTSSEDTVEEDCFE